MTDRNGRIVQVYNLAQAAREAIRYVGFIKNLVTQEPRADVGKAPKIDGIYNWQKCNRFLRIVNTVCYFSWQFGRAEAEWGKYVKLYSRLPCYKQVAKWGSIELLVCVIYLAL